MPRRLTLPLATLAALLGPGAARAGQVTLDEALRLARRDAPALLVMRAARGEADGRRIEAALWPNNPELSGAFTSDGLLGGHGARRAGLELGQTLEMGGQRSLRMGAADAGLAATRADLEAAERAYLLQAGEAYYDLLLAQERGALLASILALDQDLERASARRLQAGDVAEVDHGLIAVEALRAQADAASAAAAETRARIALNRLLGLPPSTPTRALGPFPAPDTQAPATTARPELRAAQAEHEARRHESALAARRIVPDLRLALVLDSDALVVPGTDFGGDRALAAQLGGFRHADTLLGLRLGVSLPTWNRGQGARRLAAAREDAAALREVAVQQAVAADLAVAEVDVGAGVERLRILGGVLPAVERNLALLGRAYAAGQIGAAALLAARERAFRAQLDHLEARHAFALARLRHRRAAGLALDGAEGPAGSAGGAGP